LHDNTRPHVSKVVKVTLLTLQWEVLPHAVYSSDRASLDYYLFRSMQYSLVDKHFKTYKEIKNGSMNGLLRRTNILRNFYCQIARKV